MSLARRLINLCLALVFAGYGMVVGASAHAHTPDDGQNHLLHSVVLDVVQHTLDDMSHGHDHDGGETHHHDVTGGDAGDEGTADHGGFHVHGAPAFTTAAEPGAIAAPVVVIIARRIERSSVHATGLFSPLKKPPRAVV